jgi:BirA family transcriptional regulator, biotin operon repressor / biotin---[acetyl-CoA-carboxylase] ligase
METLFIGKNTIFLSETESTNSYAIELLKNVNLHEGSVVHASWQSAGRGQRGSVWQSHAGCNLNASFVLRPTFLELRNQYYLYKVAALATAHVVADLLNEEADVRIKWPNDIIVNDRKIAGILIENNLSGERLNWSVIGIGVNVNQEEFPGLTQAVSLRMLMGKPVSVDGVLSMLSARLEKYYLALKSGKITYLTRQYRQRLYGLSTKRDFIINARRQQMFIKGVSRNGLLSLEDENGIKMEADVKDVEWIF